MGTKIQWTNETWNPIIGCSKISEGCQNCYAEKMAFRLAHIKNTGYYEKVLAWNKAMFGEWNGITHRNESALKKPLSWKKPRMIFVCSMGDLFHESVPFEWIDKVFTIMAMSPEHTFQILTKRPERMKEYIEEIHVETFKNIWIGVTAENQEQANKRIPVLLEIPAAKRFVSCEPLLSNIDLSFNCQFIHEDNEGYGVDAIKGLDWIIAGPETGPKARPMQKEWIENLYSQCELTNVPFFDKKNTLGLDLTQIPKKHD